MLVAKSWFGSQHNPEMFTFTNPAIDYPLVVGVVYRLEKTLIK